MWEIQPQAQCAKVPYILYPALKVMNAELYLWLFFYRAAEIAYALEQITLPDPVSHPEEPQVQYTHTHTHGAQWLEHRTGRATSRNIGNSDCPTLPVFSEETLKADGPFYLVSMPGEVKDPTRGKCGTCRGLHNSEINHSYVSPGRPNTSMTIFVTIMCAGEFLTQTEMTKHNFVTLL